MFKILPALLLIPLKKETEAENGENERNVFLWE